MSLHQLAKIADYKQTASLIKLLPGDAGQPITDLVTELDYPALAEDVREVLRALIFQKRYTAQTTELRQSRADLVTEKGRKK